MSIGWEMLLAVGAVVLIFVVWMVLQQTLLAKGAPSQVLNLKKKVAVLSQAELELYDVLIKKLGGTHLVFPHAKLSEFLEPADTGPEGWSSKGYATGHSVTFLITTRDAAPTAAITLDTPLEFGEDRSEVEKIIKKAGMVYLVLPNKGPYDAAALATIG